MLARSRRLGSLLVVVLVGCLLVTVYGCGGGGGNQQPDGHDATGADGTTDKGADVTDVRTDGAGDTKGDTKTDATGGDAADGRDATNDTGTTDGAIDVAPPTCTDQIKNGDETGIDCGGRCGKCPPGDPCKVAADCQFDLCRTDGTCAACLVAGDCPGIESECQHRTCTAGVCGKSFETAGTVLAIQAPGDCSLRVCSASGQVIGAVDNTDVHDDMNPCTTDTCVAGVPMQTNLPANTSCGGANHCNTGGQCIGCTVAADCPGTDTVCRTRTCSGAGVCGVTFVAQGTKLADPMPNDCRSMACDGNGNSIVVNDDTDLPAGTPCQTNICTNGIPSHQPAAAGTSCGGSLVCDGANNCVDCLSAASCPGTDTECQSRTCISGVCGLKNQIAGTLIAAQTAKDCKKVQCSGMGPTPVTVPDDTDVPNDGNACTSDVCAAGMPSNPPVSAGTSCGGSLLCNGQGACVACVTAANCPGSDTECQIRTCTSGVCGVNNTAAGTAVIAQVSGDCKKSQCNGSGAVVVVTDDTDKPNDGNACTTDVCTSGSPSHVPVASGTSCGPSLLCNGAGACVGCLAASDCPGSDTACQTRTCVNNQCGTNNTAAGTVIAAQTAGDCKQDQCDGTGHIVTVVDDTDKRVDGNACTLDVCTMGVPSNPPAAAGAACAQNGGSRCNGSGTAPACVQCLLATDCSGSDTECKVRTCTNGVCGTSNTADGTAVSSQLVGDCKKNVCSGGLVTSINDDSDVTVDNNACTRNICTAGVASNPPEPAGTACNTNGGSRCNGSGTAPACVQCLVATDCPGADTECQVRACTAGVCGFTNINNGNPVLAQIPGDCMKSVCNAGVATPQTDITDVPVDNNPCTQDVCTGGTPSNPPSPSGTTCNVNSGSVCNGTGACVQCVLASNCPGGPDTACKTRTCSVGGTCGFSFAGSGTLVTNAPLGNCQKDVCDGAGSVTTVVDDTDVPFDANACTQDLCTTGTPTNPPELAGTPCNTNGGSVCNGSIGAPACVQCLTASTCPGSDTACQTRTCVSGACGVNNAGAGTLVTQAPLGDCHKDACDGVGNVVSAVDDTDVPTTTNQCQLAVCSGGTPSNPPAPINTACNQSGGSRCDGAGTCAQCVLAATCPGSDTECQTRTCVAGLCGFSYTANGTAVTAPQTAGDCQKNVCDGAGGVTTANDDTDVPADPNTCHQNVCTNGVPSNPPVGTGTPCNQTGGAFCDATGTCVACLNDTNCDISGDTACLKTHCVSGACTPVPETVNTPVADTFAGDCHSNVCDGMGAVESIPNDADVPNDSNTCTQDICTGGVPSNPLLAPGTACNQNGGTQCDASGACVLTFMVVRLGKDDGSAALTSAATAVSVEERFESDGVIVRTTALPTVASGSNRPFALSGVADSEGMLALSGDGRYVTLGGYSAAPGLAGIANTASSTNPRTIARIDAAQNVDTTTILGTTTTSAFSGNNIRSAVTNDGTQFWAGGNGNSTTPTRGVFYAVLGATTSVLIESTSQSTRACEIFSGQLSQLYCGAASASISLVAVGTGLPTTAASASTLPGTTADSNASFYSFAFFDRIAGDNAAPDTLYVADERAAASGGGIQKWSINGSGTWIFVGTFNRDLTLGVRGLAAHTSGSGITLIGTTAINSPSSNSNGNAIIRYFDDGATAPASAALTTLQPGVNGVAKVYRGVALAPHL